MLRVFLYFGTLYNIRAFPYVSRKRSWQGRRRNIQMKKFIAIILTFCLILCAFPLQAMAYPGDIWRPGKDGGEVVQKKLKNGAFALQNEYLRVTLQKTQ